MDNIALLYRLRTGFRPGPAELTGAAWVDDWAILATVGPFAITGHVDNAPLFAVVLALDEGEQWALLSDQWVRLGERQGPSAPADEVLRRAILWVAEGSRMSAEEVSCARHAEGGAPPSDARWIGAVATLLSLHADGVGLVTASYLLKMAALEAEQQT